FADVDRKDLVGKPALLEEHRDLVTVGRCPIMQVDHGMIFLRGWPFVGQIFRRLGCVVYRRADLCTRLQIKSRDGNHAGMGDMMVRVLVRLLAAALLSAIAPLAALAQAPAGDASSTPWPTRPVRFVVPFPAGGSTDTVARLVGGMLSARLGQQFVVENRVGASGALGAATGPRAAPDGDP